MFLIIAFVYGILVALFLVLVGLLLRHTIRESPGLRLKIVMTVFTALTLAALIFSVYALIRIYEGPSSESSGPKVEREINF